MQHQTRGGNLKQRGQVRFVAGAATTRVVGEIDLGWKTRPRDTIKI
jgi:hypothetical protein